MSTVCVCDVWTALRVQALLKHTKSESYLVLFSPLPHIEVTTVVLDIFHVSEFPIARFLCMLDTQPCPWNLCAPISAHAHACAYICGVFLRVDMPATSSTDTHSASASIFRFSHSHVSICRLTPLFLPFVSFPLVLTQESLERSFVTASATLQEMEAKYNTDQAEVDRLEQQLREHNAANSAADKVLSSLPAPSLPFLIFRFLSAS